MKEAEMKLFTYIVFLNLLINTNHVVHGKYPASFVKDNKIINELKTEEYVDIVKPFLPENPAILEAGCHGGQDTVILGKSWPLGTIYAFEPVQKFVDFTNIEITKHKITNAMVFPFALSSNSGTQIFYYSNNIGAASSLLASNDALNAICNYQDTPMTVNTINLDEWSQKNKVDHIDFMWLDMEGSEYYVLSTAPHILKTVRAIITEVNFLEFRQGSTQFKDLDNFLTNNGFSLFKIWGSPRWQGTALYIRSDVLDITKKRGEK